jgi:RimJ/RimL family protein N-acetyltransferase
VKLLSKDKRIILRDFLKKDVNDYVLWNTEMIEWQDWDAPWEKDVVSKEEIKEKFENYCNHMKKLDPNRIRFRFEVCINNIEKTHIGWVISYQIDEDYEYTKEKGFHALGIDIPDQKHRRNGYGKSVLLTYIDYLKSFGFGRIYIQTWSGNLPMLNLSKKLGFIECSRLKEKRIINDTKYDAITLKLDI